MKLIESNPVLDKLPDHLLQYVLPQNYDHYTPINQATWRYVMRKNVDYLKQVAHHSYLEGLALTGISIDQIPSMYGMNRILEKIGWAAVAVDGLIPTEAFLEFQAYNVLVIASEIRHINNIEYTPSPDIIHESAGHAPIIANPEYSEYLRRIGKIGSKAISSKKENELFDAVRTLASMKEKDNVPRSKIDEAQARIDYLQANMGPPSEISRIKNLHWWTVEYGLIGDLDNPKIYGAGLLSSIGESTWCMGDQVQKLPYDLNAAYMSFDVTRPQPQLYVTPDFAHLSMVLEQYANTMAIRRGGLEGVEKLIESNKLGTVELSTGLQISGHFDNVISHDGKVVYLHADGPCALAHRDKELIGQGTLNHPEGFGSPIGKLRGINLAIEDMSPRDLEAYNFYEGKEIELEFVGDIHLKGKIVTGTRNLQGKIIVITFKDCLIRHGDKVIFEPSQGYYNMAVGKEVISAYNGPADNDSFDLITHTPDDQDVILAQDTQTQLLNALYAELRQLREQNHNHEAIRSLISRARQHAPDEWLLHLELFELCQIAQAPYLDEIEAQLNIIKAKRQDIAHMIDSGIELIEKSEELVA